MILVWHQLFSQSINQNSKLGWILSAMQSNQNSLNSSHISYSYSLKDNPLNSHKKSTRMIQYQNFQRQKYLNHNKSKPSSPLDNQDGEYDYQQSSMSEHTVISKQITVNERVKKYHSFSVKSLYGLLTVRERMLREYLSSKNKRRSDVTTRDRQSQTIDSHKFMQSFEQTKAEFINKRNAQAIKLQSHNDPSITNNHENHSSHSSKTAPLKEPLEQLIIKNNQYFQGMHQSVVNRLLDIIQANQNTINHNSMAISRKQFTINQENASSHSKVHTNSFESSAKLNNKIKESHQSLKVQRDYQDGDVRSCKNCALESPKKIIVNNIYSSKKPLKQTASNRIHEEQEQKIQKLYYHREVAQNYTTPRILEITDWHSSNKKSYLKNINTFNSGNQEKFVCTKNTSKLFEEEIVKIEETIDKSDRKMRKREFAGHRHAKQIQGEAKEICQDKVQEIRQVSLQTEKKQLPLIEGVQAIESKRGSTPHPQTKQELSTKSPVYIQIPIDNHDSQQSKGMSLAEAFAKKLGGKLPSQRMKSSEKQNDKPIRRNESNTNKKTKCKHPNNLPTNQKQNIQTNNISGIKHSGLEQKTPKSSQQPSQQLLNRLIYGKKVKVPKKQMYELTRKNYNNLPEVKLKKKEENKKKLQRQRLEKIKSYQRQIRRSIKTKNESSQRSQVSNADF